PFPSSTAVRTPQRTQRPAIPPTKPEPVAPPVPVPGPELADVEPESVPSARSAAPPVPVEPRAQDASVAPPLDPAKTIAPRRRDEPAGATPVTGSRPAGEESEVEEEPAAELLPTPPEVYRTFQPETPAPAPPPAKPESVPTPAPELADVE